MIIRLILVLIIDTIQLAYKHKEWIEDDFIKWREWKDLKQEEKSFWCIASLNVLISMPFVLYIVIEYTSVVSVSILSCQVLYFIFRDNIPLKRIIDIVYLLLLLLFWIMYL